MHRFLPLLLFVLVGAETLDISLAGDALYWKPTGSFDYVIRGPRTRVMRSDYHWGARAHLGLNFNEICSALRASLLYYRSSESAATFGTDLIGAFGVGPNQNRAVATLGVQYWLVDISLSHTWYMFTRGSTSPGERRLQDTRIKGEAHSRSYGRRLRSGKIAACASKRSATSVNVHPFWTGITFGAGVRYADIHENQRVDGNTTKGLVRNIYRGAGPALSVGAGLCIWQEVELHGRAALCALINRTRTRLTAADDGLTSFPHVTAISPASEIRLAIHYLCLEIGYELHYYWDAVQQPLSFPTLTSPLWSQRHLRSIGFAGPYLRLEVQF